MEGKAYQGLLAKSVGLFVFSVGLITGSIVDASAQANDFFTNTQVTDQRSDGTNNNPGFNPCGAGAGADANATGCDAFGTNALLGNVSTFITLGPGAVTDNMFGLVSGAALGANNAVGGAGNDADTAVTNCAPGLGDAGFNSGALGGLNGLNCGNVRIDPTTQGQTIPTDGTNLTGALIANNSADMNSGSGATLHRSQLENAFVWNPTGTDQVLQVTLANMPTIGGVAPTQMTCTADTGGSPEANPTVCGQQSMQETTGLSASTTVKVDITTRWSTTNSAAGAIGANPTITWRMHINQADVVGTGGAFDQEIEGSFEYNEAATTFPTVQYPNGESFTNGSIAAANLP